ncbi:MAG TPA: hypothetical protein DCW74_02055 [Alteromonas australica]|uniref:Uncharacterized protein n=1 Tax=Alteromonas australica TaxID=589873 RepID=A0A350NZN3_9ALTE|nr:hypothetical protein [Alteromonas australica]|tara:strand:- start:38 stop:253 length:216 start_codon:yes stop_codon:yes gene_type:complete
MTVQFDYGDWVVVASISPGLLQTWDSPAELGDVHYTSIEDEEGNSIPDEVITSEQWDEMFDMAYEAAACHV